MKTEMAMGFRFGPAQSRVSAAIFSAAASKSRFRWISPTRLLCIEQSPSYQEQIRERRSCLKPVQVLRQAPVTYFLKAEDPLDDPKHMLDFRAHTRLATVGGLDRLINVLAPAVALVGEVLRPRRAGADRRPLSSVRLIAPDSPLLPMQQILQRVAVGHIGRGGEHRVNQLRATVHSDVRLHAEVPLFSFRRLMHLRVALAVFVLRRTRRADNGRIDNRP